MKSKSQKIDFQQIVQAVTQKSQNAQVSFIQRLAQELAQGIEKDQKALEEAAVQYTQVTTRSKEKISRHQHALEALAKGDFEAVAKLFPGLNRSQVERLFPGQLKPLTPVFCSDSNTTQLTYPYYTEFSFDRATG